VTTSDHPFEQWRAEAMPLLESLLATTRVAMNALRTGPEAVSATWNQIREVASQAEHWLKTRPCPDEAIGNELDTIIGQCDRVAVTFALYGKDPVSTNFDDLATMIREMGTRCVEFLGHLDP
jgi:hypothetical protein